MNKEHALLLFRVEIYLRFNLAFRLGVRLHRELMCVCHDPVFS